LFSGEQIDTKCSTKSGKNVHIALCIVVKYVNEKQDKKIKKTCRLTSAYLF